MVIIVVFGQQVAAKPEMETAPVVLTGHKFYWGRKLQEMERMGILLDSPESV